MRLKHDSLNVGIRWSKNLPAIVLGIALTSSGCLGTEVGNGLKPKEAPSSGDHDNKTNSSTAGQSSDTPSQPDLAPISNSAGASIASLRDTMERMTASCASPFIHASERSLDLSTSRIAADPQAQKISVSYADGQWVLESPGEATVVLTTSNADQPSAQQFACSDVSRTPLSAFDGQEGPFIEFATRLTQANGATFTLRWTGRVVGDPDDTEAPFDLEQIEILDSHQNLITKLFAYY